MEPDVLFHICVYQWFRKLAQLAGIDFFLINYKTSTRAYLLISSLYLLLFSCVWTIYAYPFDKKMICASILGFDCQGIVIFHSILNATREFKDLCDFSLKIYRANTNASANKTRLQKSVNLTVFLFKNGMVLLIITAILTCIRPGISYLLTGERDTILPTNIPGINDNEIVGYTCLAVFHVYILTTFVVGTAGADLGLMTIVVQAHTMSHIFLNAVDEFNGLVLKHKRNANNKHVQASLKNLILMHIDFIKFTRMAKTVYNDMCLIQITMANAVLIVLLYLILIMDWLPAYFFGATAFFQVFEFSLLGTAIEIANDNMYKAICNILMTELPIKEQKKIIFMTLLAQHPHNLTIGGFHSLNVETFVYSMKNTYSVGMLLLNTQMQ